MMAKKATMLVSIILMFFNAFGSTSLENYLEQHYGYNSSNPNHWKHRQTLEIVLYNLNISNSTALQVYTNIELLVLYKCKIDDLQNLPNNIENIHFISCEINPRCLSTIQPKTLKLLNTPCAELPKLQNTIEELLVVDCNVKRMNNFPENLKRLFFAGNNIEHFPEFPNSLTQINCSHNKLKELPALPDELKILNCCHNHLKKLPTLPDKLRHLNAHSNSLKRVTEPPQRTSYINFSENKHLPSYYDYRYINKPISYTSLKYRKFNVPKELEQISRNIAEAYIQADYYHYFKLNQNLSHFPYSEQDNKKDSLSNLIEYIEELERWDILKDYNEKYFYNDCNSSSGILLKITYLKDTIHENCGTLNLCYENEYSFETKKIYREEIMHPSSEKPFIFEGFHEGSRKVASNIQTNEPLPDYMPKDFQFAILSTYNSTFCNSVFDLHLKKDIKENIFNALKHHGFNDSLQNKPCNFFNFHERKYIFIYTYWNGKFSLLRIEFCEDELSEEKEPNEAQIRGITCIEEVKRILKKRHNIFRRIYVKTKLWVNPPPRIEYL